MATESCLDQKTATQLLLGTLPHEFAEVKERHLLECSACLQQAQSLSASDWLTESLRQDSVENVPQAEVSVLRTLVTELEALGVTAQIAASAHEEIGAILRQPHAEDELGRLLHFRILDVLGAGGMGIVFKAEDGQLNRTVALKVMRPSLAIDPEAKQRFRREAMAVAAFEHDHIVTVYQVEEDNGIPFFSMQWLEGESLRDRLRREGKLAPPEALRITREVTAGLIEAHGRGLLHRDIKPDNIWLQGPNGRVKILDFGLVRSIEERSSLTHSGTILGTPEYMAPEQACGETVDERCDLFSLGCVLYHMLTGEPPFKAKNVVATLVAVSNANVTSKNMLQEDVPQVIAELTLDLLEREPSRRTTSAVELAAKIEELEKQPVRQSASQSAGGDKHWLWLWLATAAMACAAAIIAIQTNYGTLNIDADANVVTIVDGDSVQLVDKTTERKYFVRVGENKLRPGDYEIVTREDASGIEFTAREFTIRRGGAKDLRVWLSSPEQAQAPRSGDGPPKTESDSIAGDFLGQWNGNPSTSLGETKMPSWTTGIANRLEIQRGQPLSPLALVQNPQLSANEPSISWTYETRTHRGDVTDARYSPNGRYLATSGNDGTVRIWKDGQQQHVIVCPGTEKRVAAVAWSGDGKYLAAASDHSVTIWNVDSMSEGPQFVTEVRRRARQLAWNGDILAFSDNDGIHFWRNGELLPNLGITGQISPQPWSHDGRYFACREKDAVKVWATSNDQTQAHAHIGNEVFERSNSGLTTTVGTPVFDGEFGYFAFAVNHDPTNRNSGPGGYSELLIYDVENAARMKSIRLEEKPRAYSWHPGGNEISYLGNGKVHSINLETGETTTSVIPNPTPMRSSYKQCVWARRDVHSELLITLGGRVWHQKDKGPLTKLEWLTGDVFEIRASYSASRIVVQSFCDGKPGLNSIQQLPSSISVWDRTTRQQVLSLESDNVTSFDLSSDGKTLGLVVNRNVVELIDVDSGGRLAATNLGATCYGIRFIPEDQRLYAATENGRQILDATTGENLHVFDSSYRISLIDKVDWWSPNGKRFVRTASSREQRTRDREGWFVVGQDFEVERRLYEGSRRNTHRASHS